MPRFSVTCGKRDPIASASKCFNEEINFINFQFANVYQKSLPTTAALKIA